MWKVIEEHSWHDVHFEEVFGRRPAHLEGVLVCLLLGLFDFLTNNVKKSTTDVKLSSRFLECWIPAEGVLGR